MRVLSMLQSMSMAAILTMSMGAAGNAFAENRSHEWTARGYRGNAGGSGSATWSGGAGSYQGSRWGNGVYGGTYRGRSNVASNPDGSAQASFSSTGQTAMGRDFGGSGTYARNSNGAWAGSSQSGATGPRGGNYESTTNAANGVATRGVTVTTPNNGTYHRDVTYTQGQGSSRTTSGPNGSYSATTVAANGTYGHTTSVTTINGASYQGSAMYTPGQGITHVGKCVNASGQMVTCPY